MDKKHREWLGNDAEQETIEMVAVSSVVPLIPNINVGENKRLSLHTVSVVGGFNDVGSQGRPTRYRAVVLTS